MLYVRKEFETFGPYNDFSKDGGKDIISKLKAIQDATSLPVPKKNTSEPLGSMGGSGNIPASGITLPASGASAPSRVPQSPTAPDEQATGNEARLPPQQSEGFDPRKERLLAE